MSLQSNITEFNGKLTKLMDTYANDQIVVIQQKIGLEALRRVVMKTPVDTGRARGNWQVTIDKLSTKYKEVDKSGSKVITEGAAVITSVTKVGHIIWLTNNVNYIAYLETGTSKQAPNGMLAVTIQELTQMFP